MLLTHYPPSAHVVDTLPAYVIPCRSSSLVACHPLSLVIPCRLPSLVARHPLSLVIPCRLLSLVARHPLSLVILCRFVILLSSSCTRPGAAVVEIGYTSCESMCFPHAYYYSMSAVLGLRHFSSLAPKGHYKVCVRYASAQAPPPLPHSILTHCAPRLACYACYPSSASAVIRFCG
jgi:hypothetical protein